VGGVETKHTRHNTKKQILTKTRLQHNQNANTNDKPEKTQQRKTVNALERQNTKHPKTNHTKKNSITNTINETYVMTHNLHFFILLIFLFFYYFAKKKKFKNHDGIDYDVVFAL